MSAPTLSPETREAILATVREVLEQPGVTVEMSREEILEALSAGDSVERYRLGRLTVVIREGKLPL